LAKEVVFWGSSLKDLRAFPEDARQELGAALRTIQNGFQPPHWRAMKTVGPGVREIKVTAQSGEYRAFYIASSESAIHVLHAFEKKTQQTPQGDISLAKTRYKQMIAVEKKK
jgi:phage-related protein